MEFFDYVKYLGMYWGEPGIKPLVDALAISKPPKKISKGDEDGFIDQKKIGVCLTFTDERFLKKSSKLFPEGAMVLCNIRVYLTNSNGYKPYAGNLPKGMKLDASKTDVLQALGFPNDPKYSRSGELLPDEDDWKMRWDRSNHVLFCTFSDEGTATKLALQLPLDQA